MRFALARKSSMHHITNFVLYCYTASFIPICDEWKWNKQIDNKKACRKGDEWIASPDCLGPFFLCKREMLHFFASHFFLLGSDKHWLFLQYSTFFQTDNWLLLCEPFVWYHLNLDYRNLHVLRVCCNTQGLIDFLAFMTGREKERPALVNHYNQSNVDNAYFHLQYQ